MLELKEQINFAEDASQGKNLLDAISGGENPGADQKARSSFLGKTEDKFKFLENQQILNQIRKMAKDEQSLTLQVIELIAEVEHRKIFLNLGFGSLFDFVTQDLGYDPSSAARRIHAARAIRVVPEIKEKIADGSLSLSVVSQAQNFFRKKAQDSGQKISVEEKTEVFQILENKTTREAERELFKIAPELCLKSKEQVKTISENLTELKFVVDSDSLAKIEQLKLWISHQNPNMTLAELFKWIIDDAYLRLAKSKSGFNSKPELKPVQNNLDQTGSRMKNNSQSEAQEPQIEQAKSYFGAEPEIKHKRSRYISAEIKKMVWLRDGGCCQFVNSSNGKKCGSEFQIQLDHIHPFRHLGEHSSQNLRLFCGNHNRLRG